MHALRKLIRWVEAHMLGTVLVGFGALVLFGVLAALTGELAVAGVGGVIFSASQLLAILAAVGAQSRGAVFAGWNRFADKHGMHGVGKPSVVMGRAHYASLNGLIDGRGFRLSYSYYSGTRSMDRSELWVSLLHPLPLRLNSAPGDTGRGTQTGDRTFDARFAIDAQGTDAEVLSFLTARARHALRTLRAVADTRVVSNSGGHAIELAADVPIGAVTLEAVLDAVETIDETTAAQRGLTVPQRLLAMALRDPEEGVRARARQLLVEEFPDSEEARLAAAADGAELPSGHLAVAEGASGGEVSEAVEEGALAEVEET